MMVLYQMDLLARDVDDAIATFERENGFALAPYARKLVTSVGAQREALDELIGAHLDGWTVDRLGMIERAVLRLSFEEIRADLVPVPVAIDEAVELARRYASPEAAKLVNGVLSGYVHGGDGQSVSVEEK